MRIIMFQTLYGFYYKPLKLELGGNLKDLRNLIVSNGQDLILVCILVNIRP